jgi:hypothetical protein
MLTSRARATKIERIFWLSALDLDLSEPANANKFGKT